jgi:hypothetical protein
VKKRLKQEKTPMATNLNTSYIEQKLSALQDLKNEALGNTIPDAPKVSQIVKELNSINKDDREPFREFAKNLKEECFKKGISINNLNNDFFEVVEKKSNTPISNVVNQTEKDLFNKVKTELKRLIEDLNKVLADDLEILKDHFIIKLEANPFSTFNLLVLHDPKFFVQPINNKLTSKFPNVIFNEIEDFKKIIGEGDELQNVICLLLLSPRTNDDDGLNSLIESLKVIIEPYETFENISLNDDDTNHKNFKTSHDKDEFYEEVRFVNGTLLSNGKIKHEEEKIIKKLCSFDTPLVIYKTLKEGNSGAKVIEIRPKKRFGSENEKRYIIKYAKRDEEEKIKAERKNFTSFIEGYKGFNKYECKYEKTLCYDGLRYSYAISDNETTSYSFSDILEGKKPDFIDENTIIDRIFGSEIFNFWKESAKSNLCQAKTIFEKYINLDKCIEVLARIMNMSTEEVRESEFFLNFDKIWNLNYNYHEKVCHGDLHSENLFIDSSEYLIDFGFTGFNQALIDHTALECSLKFKHVPFYIPIEELELIEREFLSDDSFNISYKAKSISRDELFRVFEFIKQIRHNSRSIINTQHEIEYLITLYIMTFRQIRYKDMNQMYAFCSAQILGKHLVQILNL